MRPAMKFSLFMFLNALLTIVMIAMIVAEAKASTVIASIVASAAPH